MSTVLNPEIAAKGYRTLNPATGELLRTWETLDEDGVEELLERAHQAFLIWRDVKVERRAELFHRLGDLLSSRADEFARQETIEMGKTIELSTQEASIVGQIYHYYADLGPELLADKVTEVPGLTKTVTRVEPVGVALGIEPWNAPIYQASRAIAPNLMLGNTVIVKPARICAGSTLMLQDLFDEAGFPEHVFQAGLTSGAQADKMIADPRVRAVTLTGSNEVGEQVGRAAGESIKPVVLELGGSDAFVVLESANVQKAATVAATVRMKITGQVCVSPKRVIVTKPVADEFIKRYVEVFASQKVGDPLDPEVTVGPLSSDEAAAGIQALYDDAVSKGATVLLAGGRIDGPGAFFKPAVLTDITPAMRIYSEELFGPVGVIYRVPDAEAAIELANSSQYGLGGSVFGEDLEEAERVARRLDTGAVGINTYFGGPFTVPFGGTKASGVGRELGPTGMDQFANIKTYGIA